MDMHMEEEFAFVQQQVTSNCENENMKDLQQAYSTSNLNRESSKTTKDLKNCWPFKSTRPNKQSKFNLRLSHHLKGSFLDKSRGGQIHLYLSSSLSSDPELDHPLKSFVSLKDMEKKRIALLGTQTTPRLGLEQHSDNASHKIIGAGNNDSAGGFSSFRR